MANEEALDDVTRRETSFQMRGEFDSQKKARNGLESRATSSTRAKITGGRPGLLKDRVGKAQP